MTYTTTKCRLCGTEFKYPKEYGKVKYCSANCRVSAVPPKNGAEYKGATSSKYYSKRRRRHYARGDKIDPYVVYCAYNWTCHLCNEPIDPTVKLPDRNAATLDHIVPLSKGDKHEWSNVACSHAKCNSEKGAGAQIDTLATVC